MELYKRASAVASINFRCWMKDARVRFLFLCIGCYVLMKLWPLTSYGLQEGRKMTPCLLPLLFKSDGISINHAKSVLHIGMILLLCNAPFLYPTTPYMVLRSRRGAWWLGECLYIIEAALIYVLFLMLISSLAALPVATWKPEWGSALRDQSIGTQTQSAVEISVTYGVYMSMGKIGYYLHPFKTQLYTFITCWASFSVLGLLMYLISLLQKRAAMGMAVAGFLVFLDPIIYSVNVMKTDKSWIDLLSPVCWTDAGLLKDISSHNFLSIPVVAGMYLLWLVLLLVGIRAVSHRITIEIAGDQLQGE